MCWVLSSSLQRLVSHFSLNSLRQLVFLWLLIYFLLKLIQDGCLLFATTKKSVLSSTCLVFKISRMTYWNRICLTTTSNFLFLNRALESAKALTRSSPLFSKFGRKKKKPWPNLNLLKWFSEGKCICRKIWEFCFIYLSLIEDMTFQLVEV